MIKNLPSKFPKIKQKESDKMQLSEWAWNSHYWIETYKGYYECKYCGRTWTSEMPLTDDTKLCEKNPILKKIFIGLIKNRELKT